ncbi:hypothetical protein COLO4_00537 [Corchorus olitorius]|uniref:Uncharacterized protein n=1 Tax=Corchorus olitorius TaxID=93759 RepID=A0A1R3KZ38_9ROSI|nr:hypothetical protein COLO4_03281 [Corchorus olitorius]OMP12951.1 hypothetical protein COLO4_02532 [Corchorus olitorius]OMP13966.1 hypothetical protein COLO4_00537 [Corchorus olitorius]
MGSYAKVIERKDSHRSRDKEQPRNEVPLGIEAGCGYA